MRVDKIIEVGGKVLKKVEQKGLLLEELGKIEKSIVKSEKPLQVITTSLPREVKNFDKVVVEEGNGFLTEVLSFKNDKGETLLKTINRSKEGGDSFFTMRKYQQDMESKVIHTNKFQNRKLISSQQETMTKGLYGDSFTRTKVVKNGINGNDKDSISEITPSKIDGLKIYLVQDKKLAKATFNRYYSALSKAFNVIIDDKELNMRNPCKSVKKYIEDNEIERYLTKEEEEKLMQELPSYLKPIVVCALTTGLRASNVLNLRWEAINFEYNFIEILKQQNKGRKKIQLPLSEKFRKELEKIGIKESGYVFISHRTQQQYKKVYNGFQAALNRAGIKKTRFQDLRHTVATRLVANGSDLGTVKQYLAHSNIRTTERYMHPTPENMLKAVDILDGF